MTQRNIVRGDIFYVDRFGNQIGSEQYSGRPAVVVSNDENNKNSETVEIVYLTTSPKKDLPTHVTIHSANYTSIVLCEQVTTVSIERLGDYIGRVTKDEMFRIEIAVLTSLGIKIPDLKERHRAIDKAEQKPVVETVKKLENEPVADCGKDEKEETERLIENAKKLSAAMAERDTYKELYEKLLDRMMRAS